MQSAGTEIQSIKIILSSRKVPDAFDWGRQAVKNLLYGDKISQSLRSFEMTERAKRSS